VNLNLTHFSFLCRYDRDFYPFIILHLFAPRQYVLPSIFVIYTNICLLKTALTRARRNTSNAVSNAFKAHLRAQSIKGTTLLVALSTFAFILPYFGFVTNRLYTETAKPCTARFFNRLHDTPFYCWYHILYHCLKFHNLPWSNEEALCISEETFLQKEQRNHPPRGRQWTEKSIPPC